MRPPWGEVSRAWERSKPEDRRGARPRGTIHWAITVKDERLFDEGLARRLAREWVAKRMYVAAREILDGGKSARPCTSPARTHRWGAIPSLTAERFT